MEYELKGESEGLIVTTEMAKAGSDALSKAFSQQDFSKIAIVEAIYWAMRRAAPRTHE